MCVFVITPEGANFVYYPYPEIRKIHEFDECDPFLPERLVIW